MSSCFVQKLTSGHANEDSECEAVGKIFRPRECCSFPVPYMPRQFSNECEGRCQKTSNDTSSEVFTCCIKECVEEKFPFYVNGKIYEMNIVEYFKEDMELRNISSLTWMGTFTDSVTACDKYSQGQSQWDAAHKVLIKSSFAGPLSAEDKCGNKIFKNSSIRLVLTCVINVMFLTCPASSYNATPECDAMKKKSRTIDECVHKHGNINLPKLSLFYPTEDWTQNTNASLIRKRRLGKVQPLHIIELSRGEQRQKSKLLADFFFQVRLCCFFMDFQSFNKKNVSMFTQKWFLVLLCQNLVDECILRQLQAIQTRWWCVFVQSKKIETSDHLTAFKTCHSISVLLTLWSFWF